MQLPDRMLPWLNWLSQFDTKLAHVVGELLILVEPLVARQATVPLHGQEEFNGFDGIARRGQLERLLTSEWLLAETSPDEFLRRIAEHEQLFLAPRYQEPRNEQRCLAIFDAGIYQLGSLRVFHVVMWLILAERAQRQEQVFQWGIAQQPGQFYTDHSIDGLKLLLNARTIEIATPEVQQQWLNAIEQQKQAWTEQWWIGASQHDSPVIHVLCPNRVSLQHDVMQDLACIEIISGSRVKTLQLPLPQGKLFTRLLKGQFVTLETPNKTAVAASYQPNLVSYHQCIFFSPDGQYLAVVQRNRQVLVWRIPQHPRHHIKPLSNKQHPKNGELAAGFFNGKNFVALMKYPRQLMLWNITLPLFPYESGVHVQAGLMTRLPAVLSRSAGIYNLLLLDDSRQLHEFVFRPDSPHAEFKCLDTQVIALLPLSEGQAIYAIIFRNTVKLYRSQLNTNGSRHEIAMYQFSLPLLPDKLLLCINSSWSLKQHTCWATGHQKTGSWQIYTAGQSIAPIQLSKKIRVIGLALDAGQKPALLTLSADQSSIHRVYAEGRSTLLYQFESSLIQFSLSSRHLAVITSTQEVMVLDILNGSLVATMQLRG